MGKFNAKPITLRVANAYVNDNHRHHSGTVGHKFSISCYEGEKIRGVAICGRPVSRVLDDGKTLEINRLCTDGTKNVCSFLYSKCVRIAKEMGYKRVITYILKSETGTSLKASGFLYEGEAGGKFWTGKRESGKNGPREMKKRYAKYL